MITSTLVAALLSLSVETVQIGPFTCQNAAAEAVSHLQRQCKDAGMVLTFYTTSNCENAGDDGGYVNYYAVSAEGVCEKAAE